ncbi:MAG: hypothetical protein ACSHW1_17720 [Yoonia sp.]
MTTIKLYLGAHKTATTHLQGILLENRDVLEAEGTKLAAPRDIRNDWLPDFFKAQRALKTQGAIPDDLAARLRGIAPQSGTLILTEENIIGVPNDLVQLAGIYPLMGARVATIKALFPDATLELYFSVRSYDSFYRSMYSEVVRNRGFLPFDEFYNEDRFATNSWAAMIDEITATIPGENITLWRFEDFRAVMPDVLSRISGFDDVAPLIDRYAPQTTRPSLSQKTVDILGDIAPAIGIKEALKLTETINQHYAVADGHTPLSVFSDEKTATFKAAYTSDLAMIRTRHPALTILDGPSVSAVT